MKIYPINDFGNYLATFPQRVLVAPVFMLYVWLLGDMRFRNWHCPAYFDNKPGYFATILMRIPMGAVIAPFVILMKGMQIKNINMVAK